MRFNWYRLYETKTVNLANTTIHPKGNIQAFAMVGKYFATENLSILDSPACFQEMNNTGNAWDQLSKAIYEDDIDIDK